MLASEAGDTVPHRLIRFRFTLEQLDARSVPNLGASCVLASQAALSPPFGTVGCHLDVRGGFVCKAHGLLYHSALG